MNKYNGIVKDIAELISGNMSENNIPQILEKFEDIMKKYNIDTYEPDTNIPNAFQKTDMRQLCECMLIDSFKNNLYGHFLF